MWGDRRAVGMPAPGRGWQSIHYSQLGLCMAGVQECAAGQESVQAFLCGVCLDMSLVQLTADAATVLRTMPSSLPLPPGSKGCTAVHVVLCALLHVGTSPRWPQAPAGSCINCTVELCGFGLLASLGGLWLDTAPSWPVDCSTDSSRHTQSCAEAVIPAGCPPAVQHCRHDAAAASGRDVMI